MSTQRPTDARPGAHEPPATGRWLAGDEARPTERVPYTFDPNRTERLRSHVAD